MSSQPQHVAIIMDGSGRWAQRQGLSRIQGHIAGVNALELCVEAALKSDVKHLTVYALSQDNMRRPKQEVDALLMLIEQNIKRQSLRLKEQGVCLQFIGHVEGLSQSLQELIQWSKTQTHEGKQLTLTIALNYSGSDQIVRSIQHLAQQGITDISDIKEYMDTLLSSRPDLLIRTGGEQRISDFLLYHLAYTELLFLKMYWPDFNQSTFTQCLENYAARQRRFGQVLEQA
jgi:undecaprenyl diphosphate synthase